MEEIISKINERINEKGITRRELSRQTGITEQMLYLITVKHQNVSLSTLAKICDALELKIEITKTNLENYEGNYLTKGVATKLASTES